MTCFRYNGKSVSKICKEMCIPYNSIWYLMDRKGLSFEEALEVREKHLKTRKRFYYKGDLLINYCRKKKLNYFSIHQYIKKRQSTIEEAVKFYIKKASQ